MSTTNLTPVRSHTIYIVVPNGRLLAWQEIDTECRPPLSSRQRQIMELVLAGYTNKKIAADLEISQRTVENHRATIMRKTGAKSVPELVRLGIPADWGACAAEHIANLTPRQRQIMDLVLDGHPSKNIAADLDISQRTVENHRASIMKRTGAKSIPALTCLALAAG